MAITSPAEIRCPECHAIAWRRIGERVTEDVPADTSRPVVRHVLLNEDGPWDWTCDRCRYRIKPGSHLDHEVAKVQPQAQPQPHIGAGVLGALGGLRERLVTTISENRGPVTVSAAVAVSVIAAVWLLTPPTVDAPASTPSMGPSPGLTQPPAVTDFAGFAAGDPGQLAGRAAELDGVLVESVTGDVTFWIGTSRADRVFVVLDETAQPERAVKVRAGQRLRLTGVVASTPVTGVDLTPADREALAGEPIYLAARHVEVLSD